MYDLYYPQYHHYDYYQHTANSRNHNEQNNGLSHQENFQSAKNMFPSPNHFVNNGLVYPPMETFAYPNNQQHPYHIQSGSDLEKHLKHLSNQLTYLIQLNQQLLQHLQKFKLPEQSQTVSAPSGGTVIVRM